MRKASLITGNHSVLEEANLQKFFSTFPNGWPGIGLILLRFAIGLSATIQGAYDLIAPSGATAPTWVMGLAAIFVGAALLIGFLTPLAGAAAAIGNSTIGISLLVESGAIPPKACTEAELVVMSIAVVLLGPGAFSLDAHLFGRREIIIPKGHPPSRP
jgi:uncharacterized membrane protein YphA (DoxX/SURF4 family)